MATGPDNPEPSFVTCPCQHCNGSIEFDAGGFEKGETRTVECPHCCLETRVFVPSATTPATRPRIPPEIPPPASPQPVWFGSESSLLKIRMNSGAAVEVKELQLYAEGELKAIGLEKARITNLLGGAQSPFGFIGGIWSVTVNAVLQDYIVNKQSEKMANEGIALIEKLAKREQQLRTAQTFFHIGRIANIDYPAPNLWKVPIPGKAFGFIHSGDDFVVLKDLAGVMHSIRWSAVEDYSYEANSDANFKMQPPSKPPAQS